MKGYSDISLLGSIAMLIPTFIGLGMFLYHVAMRIGQMTGWWSLD